MPDTFPRILTHDELRFEILFAVQQIPKALLRQWAANNELKSDAARQAIVDGILARLDRYQLRAPAPLAAHNDQTRRPGAER